METRRETDKEIRILGNLFNRSTDNLKVKIIYPKNRPPIRAWVVERNKRKIIGLDEKNLTQLPDKRWQITREKKNPRLHEHYILKWEW